MSNQAASVESVIRLVKDFSLGTSSIQEIRAEVTRLAEQGAAPQAVQAGEYPPLPAARCVHGGGASLEHRFNADDMRTYADATCALRAARVSPAQAGPIDMVLHCPACGKQHIDAPEEIPNQPILRSAPTAAHPHRMEQVGTYTAQGEWTGRALEREQKGPHP